MRRGRRYAAWLVAALVAAVTVAGCGTRLPDSAFGPGAGGGGTAPGVTANSITVGMIDTVTSPIGTDTFSGPMYGAQAFFKALNARGGVNGRTIKVVTCDDGGSGIGNQQCVHQLIDSDHVFAFAGNSIYTYPGASYVSSQGVPDIGGQPISNAYDQYQHLYSIYGSSEPRNGKIGWDGTLYGSTEVYRYFRQTLGTRTAGVVYYNQADSARFADLTAKGLTAEGYQVVKEQVDLALPNFDGAVADMRAKHVDIVFDALDTDGNGRLCQSMDTGGLTVRAKVTTVQSWNEQIRTEFANSPACRNSIYATGSDRNYEDVQYPAVAQFRQDMATYFPDRAGQMSEWELEGYASAQWLTDAVASCGQNVTRECVERFMNQPGTYDAHGLIVPTRFTVTPPPTGLVHSCLNVARWQDAAQGGHGGWVTQVPDMNTNCFDVPEIPYKP